MSEPSDQDDIDLFRQEIGDIEHLTQDKITPVTKPIDAKAAVKRR